MYSYKGFEHYSRDTKLIKPPAFELLNTIPSLLVLWISLKFKSD